MEKKKPIPELEIKPFDARGYASEQSWYFLKYPAPFEGYKARWLIVRRYCANGDTWYGVRASFPDSHEKGLDLIPNEIKLAKEAISRIKKNWKKYLEPTN